MVLLRTHDGGSEVVCHQNIEDNSFIFLKCSIIVLRSATLGFPVDFIGLLGGVQMNGEGVVVEARSALTTILMEVNRTEVDMGDVGTGEGLSEDVRKFSGSGYLDLL